MLESSKDSNLNALSFLWLEITEKCNLECLHCYANSSSKKELFGQMSKDDWITVIKQSAQMGCQQIQFIGGEPTLHPELSSLISIAKKVGFTFIEVFTNSTYINENLIKTFLENNVQIATSFYSDDPVVHDIITKRPNSFNRTVNGIRRLINKGLSIRVGIIEMEENKGHGQRAEKYIQDLGVDNISIDFQRGIGRGSREVESINPLNELCGECWNGKLCVTSSGKAYPCVFSRFTELGQVKSGVNKIIKSKRLNRFRHTVKVLQDNNTMALCSPDRCPPNSSSCGPESKCMPGSERCVPMTQPCQPDTQPCQPIIRSSSHL